MAGCPPEPAMIAETLHPHSVLFFHQERTFRDPAPALRDNSKKYPRVRPIAAVVAMIANTFLLTQIIRALRMKSLRDKKTLPDHDPEFRDNSKMRTTA
jgi:hypothetical protein